ncbi:MAG: Kazal-type serine protease inhibitor domain-containing protein, partial [bacterium]|nr:Kazal-type serine protease inhibitor domain-containing protein [bacterium]
QARAAEVVARNALRILETGEAAPPALQRIQERVNILVPEPRPASDVVCTQEFKPVCGVDGNTYPNACVAQRQNGVRISHEGECRKEGETSGMNIRLEIEADRLNAATDSLQSSQ